MKAKVLILLLGLSFGFSAMALNPIQNTVPQDNGSRYGKDSVTCIMNLSLYREFFKQWRENPSANSVINDAMGPWYWTFNNCPRASENIYIDGAKMIRHRIQMAKTPKMKNALIDTLKLIYTQRMHYFPYKFRTTEPQKGELLGREAIDLLNVQPSAETEIYNMLKQSVALDKENALGAVFVYYFRLTTQMANEGKIDTTAVVDAYSQIMGYVNQRLDSYKAENNAGKVMEYQNIKQNIDMTFQPFASCGILVKMYQKKFDAAPQDPDVLKQVISALDSKQCYNNDLYYNANVNLYKVSPTPGMALLLGRMMMQKNKYDDAIKYLSQANVADPDQTVEVDMLMAQAYQLMNDYPKSREMALKALKVNPKYGLAYELIGDLYAQSATKCGNNDLTKLVAYWAAVDKYEQAKRVDPDLTSTMNSRIAIYKQHFPTTESLFFHNLKPGEKYKVGCWINEETIVRSSGK
jgi:tetratricopeptide (TPR) repeat protein